EQVGVGVVEDHLVDLLRAPLVQELLGGHEWQPLGGQHVVERVEMVGEHLPGRAAGVVGLEVEGVGHPVEDQRVTDHGSSLVVRAAAYGAGSATVAGSGRKRSLARAASESRSGDHGSCHTISTVAVSTPGSVRTAVSMSPRTAVANGHQPEVSTSSTRAAP